ncbi:MAG: helix-turn-helix transcriptional regulator [Nostoc sp. C3-bin3]|nr:helix-turn-helix transcriptional regulator [Nostoc sp. C3-bin3]
MSQNPSTVKQSDRWQYPDVFPRSPVLTSYKTDWSSISLEYQHQPAGETPTVCVDHYMVGIYLGQVCQLEHVLDGHLQTKMVSSGAVMLCPMHRSHSFRWDREIHAMGLNLMPELLARNASELSGTDRVEFIPHFALYDPLIQQIGLALKADLESHKPGGRLYAESMANALAVHLLRRYSSHSHQPIRSFDGLVPHQLRQVTDYINDNLEQDLGLEELAAIAQLSQFHFSRSFKRSMGLSPHQYVIRQRVERAKQLLKQGKMSICEVAIACGFTHQSHLNRHFKRLTGVTPKTFSKS